MAALQFVELLKYSQDFVVIDHVYEILGEYENNLPQQSVGFELVKQLHNTCRFDYQIIEFDEAGHAILPSNCTIKDNSDKKFVAVALAHPDHPSIYYAIESDWEQAQENLNICDVRVVALCAH